jgi:mono/diheme cytochrome c family protein
VDIRKAIFVAGAFVVAALSVRAGAHDRITTKVTWDREISPIVQARCAGCHSPRGRSTIPLTTYQEARPWAAAIKEEVLTRRMPLWNAARGYGAFANDPSLSPFEIALIAAWVDGGAPETGDKARAASAPEILSKTSPPEGFAAPARATTRSVMLPCGDNAVSGRLLAVTPHLGKDGSLGVAALLPGGRQEIVVWVRHYDPQNPTTYWLRTPLVLPAGSQLRAEGAGRCALEVTFAR